MPTDESSSARSPLVRRIATSPLLDLLANQAGWWWCILFARSGQIAASLLLPLTYVGVHAWLRSHRSASAPARTFSEVVDGRRSQTAAPRMNASGPSLDDRGIWSLALVGAAAGFVGDSVLVQTGFLSFPMFEQTVVSPPFMVALWAMFAVSLRISARFLLSLAIGPLALLGAVAGPLAYLGGARLGVLEMSPYALFAIAAEWAVLVNVVVHFAKSTGTTRRQLGNAVEGSAS